MLSLFFVYVNLCVPFCSIDHLANYIPGLVLVHFLYCLALCFTLQLNKTSIFVTTLTLARTTLTVSLSHFHGFIVAVNTIFLFDSYISITAVLYDIGKNKFEDLLRHLSASSLLHINFSSIGTVTLTQWFIIHPEFPYFYQSCCVQSFSLTHVLVSLQLLYDISKNKFEDVLRCYLLQNLSFISTLVVQELSHNGLLFILRFLILKYIINN